jgi:outer membrane protein assembly factor BamA
MNDTSVFGIRKKVPLYILTLIFLSSYNYSQKVVRYELSSLSFVGNNTFSSSTLSDQIQSKETPWWGFKFLNTFSALGAPPAYFDSTILRFDIQALKTFYEVNGFFLVNISTEYNIDTSAFTAELLYKITENVPFNYNRVIFHGLDNVSLDLQEIIKANFDIDYTDTYSESEVESKIDGIISTLNDNGYMDASFDSTIIAIDSVKSIANLNIYLNAGSR